MKQINYNPRTALEKFGAKVFDLLVENFPRTFYVGGMVRDLLLDKIVTDIDIVTEATPEQVAKILLASDISIDLTHQNFGIITATNSNNKIEIATLRKDLPSQSRYPKVAFIKSPKIDSKRRDFTINALYLSPISGKILDFHQGLKDLKLKNLKFIGNPEKRIKEDPLRIIRALRFARTLDFKLDSNSKNAIKNNFPLVKTLTKSKIIKELNKIKNTGHKNFIIKQTLRKFLS